MALQELLRRPIYRLGLLMGLKSGTTDTAMAIEVIDGAAKCVEQGQIGGERNPSSTTNNYDAVRNESNVTILTGTGAVTIGAGGIDDTELMGLFIMPNGGGAVTVTVTGFPNEAGAAKSLVFTGSTTVDTIVNLGGLALRNSLAALTVTASVADKAAVFWRPI